jgi:AcrR family transcriptional regulator
VTGKRTRRRPAELRRLILDGATEVFSTKGYPSSTLEDIAQAAGVSVSVIYRHFTDKAELFRETLVAPFTKSLEEYSETWRRSFSDAPLDDDAVMRELVTNIYDSMAGHREVLATLGTAERVLDESAVREVQAGFGALFERLGSMGIEEASRRGWFEGEVVELTSRCLYGMMVSMIVYEQWFLRRGETRISREQLVDHVTRLMLYGLRLAPAAPA